MILRGFSSLANQADWRKTWDGVDHLVKEAAKAAATSPRLAAKRISPHQFRHSTAMHLLRAGVDISVIALGLGHESIETTHIYLQADLATKSGLWQSWFQSKEQFRNSSLPILCWRFSTRSDPIIRSCGVENELGTRRTRPRRDYSA
jgi:hypothetical protein